MIKKDIPIINKLGLHARAAARLVDLTSRFKSEITLVKDGDEVNGKSILGILTLAAAQGSVVEVIAEGEDEKEAIEAVEKLFQDRFGERQ